MRSTRSPAIDDDSNALEDFEFVARVPTRIFSDSAHVAFRGNPPGAPPLLPVPCLGCGARTDWVVTRTDCDVDEVPLCESCQEAPGMEKP